MNKYLAFTAAVALFGGGVAGCQSKTPAEKVENKIEDAAHETGQAFESAGEKVKDSVE